MIIDGKAIARAIEQEIKNQIALLQTRAPCLAFVLVGDNPASLTYIRRKTHKCREVGIRSIDHKLPAGSTEKALLATIDTLNNSDEIDGILVQLPLPSHLPTRRILEAVNPDKDVDGFHPLNLGKLLTGVAGGFIPCTPYGITTLLKKAGIELSSQHVVIVGRSTIVGKPLAALLVQKRKGANATVTITHSGTRNLGELTRAADILVAALGKPHFIRKEMVKTGATVIDVGINRLGKKLVGDVHFEEVKQIAGQITPVPGGVGPMTIAMLLVNTLLAYKRRHIGEIGSSSPS